jgi:hypothetical protein
MTFPMCEAGRVDDGLWTSRYRRGRVRATSPADLCLKGDRIMMDPMTRADLYWKESVKHSDLAKSASSPFLRDYYRRVAERYLSSEGELRRPENEAGPDLKDANPSDAP